MAANALLLMYPLFARQAMQVAGAVGLGEVRHLQTLEELHAAVSEGRWDVLLAFGTGVVVPAEILSGRGLAAFNIHAASPRFPGRDPHHFAAYEDAPEYGATLHEMTASVDQGPIVAVDLEPVPAGCRPEDLLALGNAAGLRLMKWFLESIGRGVRPAPDPSMRWSGQVRRRKDFIELCRVDARMSDVEFARRLRACAMPGFTNLWTEVHGRRFRLERPAEAA